MQELALPVCVDTTAILFITSVLFVSSSRKIQVSQKSSWLIGFDTPPADFVDQQAADSKCIVADQFGVKTISRLSCEQTIEGIGFGQFRARQ